MRVSIEINPSKLMSSDPAVLVFHTKKPTFHTWRRSFSGRESATLYPYSLASKTLPLVTIRDKWFLFSIIGIYLSVAVAYAWGTKELMGLSTWLVIIARTVSTAGVLYLNRWLVLRSLKHAQPGVSRSRRFFRALPTGVAANSLLMLTTLMVDNYFRLGVWSLLTSEGIQIYFNQQPVRMGVLISALFKSAVVFSFFYFVYESLYNYLLYRKTQQQQEMLEKERLQSRLDSLKQQINPHFLFNSLNSLSALIVTDPEKAEEFVEEMSRVYRYLLQSNEGPLTTLRKEVEFIRSYLMLLKTRFGDGLQVVIDIKEPVLDYLIPPMSLQLLVENAVKHNITDIDKPLKLTLYDQSESLIVSNNIQKKTVLTPSTGFGLKSIRLKYHLLNYPEVRIDDHDGQFTVRLPLIAPNKNAPV